MAATGAPKERRADQTRSAFMGSAAIQTSRSPVAVWHTVHRQGVGTHDQEAGFDREERGEQVTEVLVHAWRRRMATGVSARR